MGYRVRFTADRITEESAAEGLAAESGWIDPSWSMTTIYPSPDLIAYEEFDTLKEAEDYIEENIGSVGYEDAPDNYYAQDSKMDLSTGDNWNYAAHVEEF